MCRYDIGVPKHPGDQTKLMCLPLAPHLFIFLIPPRVHKTAIGKAV